jgi:alpha-L-rhamnosidase
LANLVGSPAPPVRRTQTIRPSRVSRIAGDRHVVDLGQNINGWLRLSSLGPRDTTLRLTYGEALDASGDVTLEHLVPVDFGDERGSAGQVDVVVADGEVLKLRENASGTRAIEIAEKAIEPVADGEKHRFDAGDHSVHKRDQPRWPGGASRSTAAA